MPIRQLKLEMAACQVLLDWYGQYVPLSAEHVHNGWRCRVVLEPVGVPIVGEIPTRLTDCEFDVLEVLRESGERMTRPEIVAALETDKKIHGESTVVMALGTLKERGLIIGPRPGSRDGYCVKSQ